MASWPPNPDLIGKRTPRVDGQPKVTGRAKFTFDIVRPGMLHAKILRSPHAHARVLSIDLSAAQKAPGVKAVMAIAASTAGVGGHSTMTIAIDGPTIGKELMYHGDEVAAVAAITEAQAEDALRLIKIDYDVLPHVATIEQAMKPGAPIVFAGGNTREGDVEQAGDLEAGFRQAAATVEQTYTTQVITHVSPETHGCVCEWAGDKLTAWVSTQAVHATRDAFASTLRLPPANVRVIADFMGGGFGSKLGPDIQGIVCAQLAKLARAPVKLMLDRKEEHLATGNRPSAAARIRAGVSAEGALTAFDAVTWGTGGAGAGSAFPLPYLYQFPNRRRRHTDVFINAGRQRPMRAPGHPQGCFITEMLMDELADGIQMDPLTLRIKNLPAEAPDAQWRAYFPMAAEKIGWSRRHPTGDQTPGPIKRGLGCAANRWGGGGQGAYAHCDILPDGGVVMRCGTQDIGTGTRTLVAMVTAETLGLPIEAIKVEIGDSILPLSGGSTGSATAASVTPAIRVTAERALAALAAKVAPALGVDAGAIVASRGRVFGKDDPSRSLAWKDACRLLRSTPISADGEWTPGLSSNGSSGVQFAEVEVDVEMGVTRVMRVVCVQDCGLLLDPLTAESQVHGGVIMGVNYALFEDRILDRQTGQMVNPDMESYLLAGASDAPEIDVTIVNTPERGVIGIGEPPTISTAAAVANAVANATGVRVRSLPITPAKVLDALQKAGGTA